MTGLMQRFYEIMSDPLAPWARALLAVLVLPLALSFTMPLWNIHMVAPQYPDGLDLDMYAHTIEGDVNEINTLNHYIGMARIDRASLSDLDWIPFAIGGLALLALRVAVVGDIRSLIDLSVLLTYFGAFSLFRFYYKLYVFGHNLDPRAPFEMEPFTPVVFGTQQIANFTTSAYPRGGTLLITIFATGVMGLMAWHLVRGLRQPR
ncbi:MAG: hypothetical protein JRG76_06220 [Deltaproteobacteria bacterium]|nr:hypothetical protein [Deltaproteobacteria bacterium]MBW2414091.1 hypothetical protein [Deltaproteobacteria bacterium]